MDATFWEETAPFPDDVLKLGCYFVHMIGPAMMAKILTQNE